MTRQDLEQFFKVLLSPDDFQDYGPNGLQVEGCETIKKIAFSVSASAEAIAIAAENNADAMVVHHGLFWKFHGCRTITAGFKKRIFPLVCNDISLFGYHLPLDAHLQVGNAASLAKLIGIPHYQSFGNYKGNPTGVKGELTKPLTSAELTKTLASVLNHSVIVACPDPDQKIRSVGIITGGANSDWLLAEQQGLDAFITGEMSEHDWHESREACVHMFAGGHHATERFGIQALMQRVLSEFNVEAFFIDSENPA